MSHLPSLIIDLALILFSASVASLIFKKLKQPVVLAYIVAGIFAGPHITFFPTVTNPESINIWADIGVIFLLFALGLDFSFKKLIRVGTTAVIATTTIVVSMMSVGYLTGLALGWSQMNSIFLGGMLCMSSTMIIIKVFDDMGLQKQGFAGIVLGILVVEDLFAVLLMVLLSTLAVSKQFEGVEMLESILKLLAFLLFWFVVGIYLIPTLFKKAKAHLNDETLLVVSLSLCFGMVYLATQAGFSSALGAFVMGSILAETMDAERIEHQLVPVKNLFGAIFFVSVGMMLDILVVGEYILPITIISMAVIIGQTTFGTIGILLAGQPLKIAMRSGFSLAQIGEFSFIIAATGLSLGVIDEFLYPVIVAVSVVTVFCTPYLIKFSEPAYQYAEKHLPVSLYQFVNKDASGARPMNEQGTWKKLLKAICRLVIIYLVLSLMIIFLSMHYLLPFIKSNIEGLKGSLLFITIVLLILSPLLRAIMVKKNRSIEFRKLWVKNKINRSPLLFIVVVRIFICIFIVGFLFVNVMKLPLHLSLLISCIIVAFLLFSKRVKKQSILIERRFKHNLNARQEYEYKTATVSPKFVDHLLNRDLHLSDFVVNPNYSIIGKTLKELNFRQSCGVNIVTIIRGDKRINIPGGEVYIYPFDKIIVLGTDDQMTVFQSFIEKKGSEYSTQNKEKEIYSEVNLEQIRVESNSKLIGKTIVNSRIRDKYNCLLVGIERQDSSIMNPEINLDFSEDDVLWVVGERSNIKQLSSLCIQQKAL
ncbi:sodium:proton antiporter [Bacteroidales bacterium]|nr:sodium:proton antiporter [Bacteroidales bacterium]